jgi:hypothetical protein
MRGKLLFITGGLVGYVLGARAGRKRYDQIAAAANDFWNAPPVQRRVTEVRDAALELVGDVPTTLYKAGKKALSQAAAKKKRVNTSATAAQKAEAPRPAARPQPTATSAAGASNDPDRSPAA